MVFQPLGTPLAIPGMDFEWKAEFWEWALPELHALGIPGFLIFLEFSQKFQG